MVGEGINSQSGRHKQTHFPTDVNREIFDENILWYIIFVDGDPLPYMYYVNIMRLRKFSRFTV